MIFKIAFRNIFRNTRRSVMTLLTIAVGAVANLVFGAYVIYIFLGIQGTAIQAFGHLQVFQKGYFDYGSGNPGAYAIDDYLGLMKLLKEDPVIGPRLAVITPTQAIGGIAGNFAADRSKTFFGTGFIPSDRDRMRSWQEGGTSFVGSHSSGMQDAEISHGVVGTGLARILGLCEPLHLTRCPQLPPHEGTVLPKAGAASTANLAELAQRDLPAGSPAPSSSEPRIDLLAATAGGAPNVVSLYVERAEPQTVKEYDDNYIGMNLVLAQQLLYGRGTPKASAIVLQLRHSKDMDLVRERLQALFQERNLSLEVRDFTEIYSSYRQIIGFFTSIFTFISVIIGVVVLFTVANTMGMSVMERVEEIGTARAMGLRRQGIRSQFLAEGAMLGVLGGTAGVILATIVVFIVNHSGLTWVPPGNSLPVPLRLDMFGRLSLVVGIWVGLALVATIASWFPANRASQMPVVDALRHV
ncbi:MAG TPA: FtsX-like permease family protein [bacterium]|nr:FtsX-like permease family protein [bacterium]